MINQNDKFIQVNDFHKLMYINLNRRVREETKEIIIEEMRKILEIRDSLILSTFRSVEKGELVDIP